MPVAVAISSLGSFSSVDAWTDVSGGGCILCGSLGGCNGGSVGGLAGRDGKPFSVTADGTLDWSCGTIWSARPMASNPPPMSAAHRCRSGATAIQPASCPAIARSRNTMPAITRIVGIGVSFSAATTLSITHLLRLAYPSATNYSTFAAPETGVKPKI
jgi:hypothetical protein